MRPVWDLYASLLIAILQRLLSLIISQDFDVLRKVIMKRGMFTVVVPSACDRRVAHICLTLITSKPRFTNPSEVSSAGVEIGRRRVTAFMGFWDLR
jgi:hypothetical protein